MGKRLAILGHNTRGNEVIELLEMLGGVNGKIDKKTGEPYNVYNGSYFVSEICNVREVAYYIDFESQIRCIDIKDITTDFICYSFEMFLKTFPFKVGNFVRIPEYESEVRILKMKWCPVSKHIEYMVCPNDEDEWFTANELLEDNDDPNEMTKDMEQKDKAKAPNLKGEDYSGKRFGYKIPDGYEFDTISNGKIILKPIKPKYPTTYEECEKILGLEGSIIEGCLGYEYKRLNAFQKLLMCRDAYWKITGEQMCLDRPWKADFTQGSGIKYIILFANGRVIWNRQECETVTGSRVLAFPTAEMRDAFYENFKNEIEQCKELL